VPLESSTAVPAVSPLGVVTTSNPLLPLTVRMSPKMPIASPSGSFRKRPPSLTVVPVRGRGLGPQRVGYGRDPIV